MRTSTVRQKCVLFCVLESINPWGFHVEPSTAAESEYRKPQVEKVSGRSGGCEDLASASHQSTRVYVQLDRKRENRLFGRLYPAVDQKGVYCDQSASTNSAALPQCVLCCVLFLFCFAFVAYMIITVTLSTFADVILFFSFCFLLLAIFTFTVD